MTDELRNKILAYNRRIKADRAERDELKSKLDRIREKVSDMKEALDLLGVVPKDN